MAKGFRKYMHIERFGTASVEGIELGTCYIFPKIDGTNASVWLDDTIRAGSRRRDLALDDDNAGFYNAISQDEKIAKFLKDYPQYRLFGEWLVPHTLKTYRDDAWRKFYVFDVAIDIGEEELQYVPYEVYRPLLMEYDVDFLVPLAILKNPDVDSLLKVLEINTFLIKDGAGTGEGVVIKNYDFQNRYGRQVWAKIVTSEFKERYHRDMGAPKITIELKEQDYVDAFLTKAFVEKEYNKIVNEMGGWKSKYIPRLLNTVYYEFVTEEIWNIVKKFKNPTINFKTLNAIVIGKVKEYLPELF